MASKDGVGVGGSDDGDKSVWDSEGEVARSLDGTASPIATSRNKLKDAPGPSLLHGDGKVNGAGPSASLVEDFVEMGLIKENGHGDAGSLLELLLTYKAIGNDPSLDNSSASVCCPRTIGDDKDILANWDAHDASTSSDRDHISDDSGDEDFLHGLSRKDEKIESLVRMGFPKDEAEMAIVRCGQDAPMSVLVDLIYSSESSEDGYYGNFSDHEDDSFGGRKEKRKISKDAEQGSRGPLDGSQDEPMPLPNPMVGFNLPNVTLRSVDRSLPSNATGPPFFYYENVAIAPKGVWTTISRFLYDIQPEFVDSRFLCAAARKRGYIQVTSPSLTPKDNI